MLEFVEKLVLQLGLDPTRVNLAGPGKRVLSAKSLKNLKCRQHRPRAPDARATVKSNHVALSQAPLNMGAKRARGLQLGWMHVNNGKVNALDFVGLQRLRIERTLGQAHQHGDIHALERPEVLVNR